MLFGLVLMVWLAVGSWGLARLPALQVGTRGLWQDWRWLERSLAEPGLGLAVLVLYGYSFSLAAIFIFRRQGLMAKS